ncbi:MAG: hypothetical protein Q9219_001930 [cf. Caloplaca sp. 3 TL-2023]
MPTHPHRSSRRSRSASPPKASPSQHRHHRQRTRSPQPHHARPTSTAPITLPFQAQLIRKGDLEHYKPIFGLYLDIQKHLILEDLDEREVRGRWKRLTLVRNRGELAEGWYDPETLRKARASAAADEHHRLPSGPLKDEEHNLADEEEEDDGFGPALPAVSTGDTRSGKQSGPSIPNLQDLQVQRELEAEASLQDRESLRYARKEDRRLQKEQLDDLVPRATAGTKDRQLERKADLRASNNAFASAKSDATFAEVPEADLMGDEEGGLGGYKKKKAEEERKKNEREIRREAILRARKEERDERIKAYKAKEEKTMEGLVALAKARFG